MTKFIIVTGGVMSGIGKGVVSSSLGFLLKCTGHNVNMGKIDPYLNIDAGTMNPYEHGECFVLSDGTEADLDLGCYERFLEQDLTKNSAITSGQIYRDVINQERKGDHLGKTIQVIPHITNEIIRRIELLCTINNDIKADYVIIELGGTVGDFESDIYYNAFPQLYNKYGRSNIYHVHVVPILQTISGEMKTKPAQQSVSELNKRGIIPDILSLRLPNKITDLPEALMDKIQRIAYNAKLLINPNCSSVYGVPYVLHSQCVLEKCFGIREQIISKKQKMFHMFEILSNTHREPDLKVLVVGKYLYTDENGITSDKGDAYLSIRHAIDHASFKMTGKLYTIEYLDLINEDSFNKYRESNFEKLREYNAIILSGGFGKHGYEEMIEIAKFTRENNIPTLGICLGFQMMVLEYFRNVIGDETVTTSELYKVSNIDGKVLSVKNKHKFLIDLHYKSKGDVNMGGTLRKGVYDVQHTEYVDFFGEDCTYNIQLRFRHRYHLNNKLLKTYKTYEKINDNTMSFNNEMYFRGRTKDIDAPTEFELKGHKCYVGTQAHCELTSRVTKPSRMFIQLLG
jgi:CTP synthase